MSENEDYEVMNSAETLLDAGEGAAGVAPRVMPISPIIDADGVYAVLEQDGHSKRVKLATDIMAELDKRAPGPRDRRGTTVLHEIKSLIAFVNRFKIPAVSIAYANVASFRVDVVIDEHPEGADVNSTAWRAHRATYTCPRSQQWDAWTRLDGQSMVQEKFADFIEARLEDISSQPDFPKPLEMLTMARNLIVRTKGTFERQLDPTTGNGVLVNKTENETGSTIIPRAFMLAIPVFEGGVPYLIEARVRLAVADGRATFSYTLHRRAEIERAAFQEVRDEIEEQCAIPVLAGTP